MTSITSNMHQKYDEVQKELNSLSKNEFKQMIKERKTTEAKKTFFFFVLSISFLSFALLLLIPLILFNKARILDKPRKQLKMQQHQKHNYLIQRKM